MARRRARWLQSFDDALKWYVLLRVRFQVIGPHPVYNFVKQGPPGHLSAQHWVFHENSDKALKPPPPPPGNRRADRIFSPAPELSEQRGYPRLQHHEQRGAPGSCDLQ